MLSCPLSACVYSSADSGAHPAILRWEVSSSTARNYRLPGNLHEEPAGHRGQTGFGAPLSLLKAILPGPMCLGG